MAVYCCYLLRNECREMYSLRSQSQLKIFSIVAARTRSSSLCIIGRTTRFFVPRSLFRWSFPILLSSLVTNSRVIACISNRHTAYRGQLPTFFETFPSTSRSVISSAVYVFICNYIISLFGLRHDIFKRHSNSSFRGIKLKN